MKYLAKKPFIVIFIFTLVFIFFLDKFLGVENTMYRAFTAAVCAAFLSPRKKKIQTQSGEKTQITWFFLKKPIILD